jgi:predicted Zn-dependent peptidase
MIMSKTLSKVSSKAKEFSRIVLKNGMRIITVPQPGSLAATMLVLVEAGSKYESKDINGLSHFLEHMCFKGTLKRPTAMDITRELDGIGAEYNAFTSQEWTGYYAKVQSHELDTIIDVLSDMYLNPTFDEKEIEKEKGVIIEEINMYEDTPQRRVQELFMQLVYGDQPAGWDIGGRKEVIRAMTRDHFVKYRSKHYLADATTVVVAGSFNGSDEKALVKKLEHAFASIPLGKKEGKLKVVESQKAPAVQVKFKETDQTHLVIGVRAFDVYDKRRVALGVLGDILGGGMSSRLFQKVREELGAAYYVKADADLFTDHGLFTVSAGVHHPKLQEVIKAILGELHKMAAFLVTEKELEQSKDHMAGRMVLGLETSDSLAMYYGGQEVHREKMQTPAEYLKEIKAVTREEVLSVAKDIFRNDRLNLALIGPMKDDKDIKDLFNF